MKAVFARPCRFLRLALIFLCAIGCCTGESSAAVTPISSPAGLDGGVTFNFEGYSDRLTTANTLFASQGITFGRDDGARVYIWNSWTALGRGTTSPDSVLATIRDIPIDPTWATHLNVSSAMPLLGIGAYFGNDQDDPDFRTVQLSVFGLNDEFLGTVQVRGNDNTDVDQFIGLTSDVPFTRIRFENFDFSGTPSQMYSVILDDFTFVPVPEPSTIAIGALGLLALVPSARKRITM
jgi:hypothetical protein